ncbi:MAG: DUF4249 family protein [Cytophagales bacterium]
MKSLSLIVSSLYAIFLISCASDPVRLNIIPKGGEPRIVIFGQVTDNEEVESSYVRITKSASFFEPQAVPFVEDAVVTVTDDEGNSWQFNYDKEGYYKPLSPLGLTAKNQEIRLNVTVGSITYSYASKMTPVAPGRKLVDSLTSRFRLETEPGVSKDGYYVYLWGGKDNQTAPYLFLRVYRNDSLLTRNMDDDNRQVIFLAESRFFQDRIEGVELPGVFKKDDLARAVMLSVGKDEYDYLTAISNQMNNSGGLFDGPPANVKSKFNNGALGVFLVSSLQWDSLRVK